MRKFWTLLTREVRSYFYSPIAYIVIGFFASQETASVTSCTVGTTAGPGRLLIALPNAEAGP